MTYFIKVRVRNHKTYKELCEDIIGIDSIWYYALTIPLVNFMVVFIIFNIICPIAYLFDYKVIYKSVKERNK